MNTTSLFKLQPSFDPSSFPDLRLCDRAFTTQQALAQNLLHNHPFTPALRKGTARFLQNPRIDPDELLRDSFQCNSISTMNESIILSCEDTSLIRYENIDAGPLMSGDDIGYVFHYSAAVTPGVGIPFAWLGARIINRAETLLRNQNHKTRPLADRESIKWTQVRDEVHENLANIGFTGEIISINDREGDAWSSLTDISENFRKAIVRSCQDRKIKNSTLKLRSFLHGTAPAAEITISVSSKDRQGKSFQRKVLLEIRWAKIQLMPPQGDIFAKKKN
jgi:hypothetical protein